MGCFSACFGSYKVKTRRNQQKYKAQHREQRYIGLEPVQSPVSSEPVWEKTISPELKDEKHISLELKDEEPISTEVKDKKPFSLEVKEEKPSSLESEELKDDKPVEPSTIARKKVTFDSNVQVYEHGAINESSTDVLSDSKECQEGKNLKESSKSKTSFKDGSVGSSSGSYPPNHRYQNSRGSDEPLDYDEDSDLDDLDGDSDDDTDYDPEDETDGDGELEYEYSKRRAQGKTADADSPMPKKPTSSRHRSGFVHAVLHPVENLTQWKAMKSKKTTVMKTQKENLALDEETRISVSSEPSTNCLGTLEAIPLNKTGAESLDTPEKSMSNRSAHSETSLEDRPILGALTVEELRQFTASTPWKSPSRSPDDMVIIGSVGSYWNDQNGPAKGSGASSCKGIPNMTSKYREDKRVHWHSTPFETRLERALDRGAADAYSSPTPHGL